MENWCRLNANQMLKWTSAEYALDRSKKGEEYGIEMVFAKAMKYIFSPSAMKNCQIDRLAKVGARCDLTKVSVGKCSYIGSGCFFVNTSVGKFCSIAERCVGGGATHPTGYVSTSPAFIMGLNGTKRKFAAHSSIRTPRTVIENDVWLGTGVYIKAGVTIHTGAIVGMNSVVTHDIPAYEIWAGNPARKIKDRFDDEIKSRLLDSEWWEYDDGKLLAVAGFFNDPKKFLEAISGI